MSTTSHGHLRPDPVGLRDPCDFLFEADGQRDPLLQALYATSLVHRRDVNAIDRVLDAHRAAHGEPEQVAYALLPDDRHDRSLPLVACDVQEGDLSLHRYLEEHHAWNPVTKRERELCSQNDRVVA